MSNNTVKLKYLCQSINSTIAASELKDEGKTPVYGASGLSGYSDSDGISTDYLGIVKDGAGVGRINKYEKGTLLVGTMSYILPKEDNDIDWIKYCIIGLDLAGSVDKTTIPHIYFSDYGNKFVPFLTRNQQKETAKYLESKVSSIDELISVEEAQIEKLKMYRTDLISKSVSSSLVSSKTRESGIAWLRQIPESWKVTKLKYAYTNRTEKASEGNLPYIALENVESSTGKYINTNSGDVYDLTSCALAEPGDVIFGKLRPYLAKSFLIEKKSLVSSEFAVFYSKNGNSAEYLKYLFLSEQFIDVINSSTYGTKMPRANVEFIKNLLIAIPSPEEQRKICATLNTKLGKLSSLINVKLAKIAALKEYKKSFIYETMKKLGGK